MLLKYPVSSWSILITSVLNWASDRLAISLSLGSTFSGALICSFIWAFFWSLHACYTVRGGALGVHQVAELWCCMWERGSRGNNATCSGLRQFSVTSPATHNQIGPFWCWFPRWVSLHTFKDPAGLSSELSCEAGSFSHCCLNPNRCFQLEALRLYFPVLEPWVVQSVSLPSCSSRFTCMQMWAHPGPPSPPCLESSPPWLPSPPLLPLWMNVSSLTS